MHQFLQDGLLRVVCALDVGTSPAPRLFLDAMKGMDRMKDMDAMTMMADPAMRQKMMEHVGQCRDMMSMTTETHISRFFGEPNVRFPPAAAAPVLGA